MGTYQKYGVCPGRLPGQGSMAFDRMTAPPGEGRKVFLPLPVGCSQGSGGHEGQDIGPSETEYGRAIHCETTDYGALQGGGAAAGYTGPTAVVGAAGNRLESGKGKGGSGSGTGGSKRGGDRDTKIEKFDTMKCRRGGASKYDMDYHVLWKIRIIQEIYTYMHV